VFVGVLFLVLRSRVDDQTLCRAFFSSSWSLARFWPWKVCGLNPPVPPLFSPRSWPHLWLPVSSIRRPPRPPLFFVANTGCPFDRNSGCSPDNFRGQVAFLVPPLVFQAGAIAFKEFVTVPAFHGRFLEPLACGLVPFVPSLDGMPSRVNPISVGTFPLFFLF